MSRDLRSAPGVGKRGQGFASGGEPIVSTRSGFTMVELLVVIILSILILLAVYQVLITNQRTYTVQSAEIQATQRLRGAMNVLYSELREISPADGDLVAMDDTTITVRSMRKFGLVCQVSAWGSDPTVLVRRVGPFFEDGDSVRVFFDNDPDETTDDTFRTAVVDMGSTSGLTCTGSDEAQLMDLDGVSAGSPPDSILPGAPVREFVHYVYELRERSGEVYLMRMDPDGSWAPLVGPLDRGDGVEFEFLDSGGSVTTNATQVAQINVTLRTSSDARNQQTGEVVSDSLTARIFARN